jgi:hypothetical protein
MFLLNLICIGIYRRIGLHLSLRGASNQRFKAGKWPRSCDCISEGTIQGYTAMSAIE